MKNWFVKNMNRIWKLLFSDDDIKIGETLNSYAGRDSKGKKTKSFEDLEYQIFLLNKVKKLVFLSFFIGGALMIFSFIVSPFFKYWSILFGIGLILIFLVYNGFVMDHNMKVRYIRKSISELQNPKKKQDSSFEEETKTQKSQREIKKDLKFDNYLRIIFYIVLSLITLYILKSVFL